MDTAGVLREDPGAGPGDIDGAAVGDMGGVAIYTIGDMGGVAIYTLGDHWRSDRDERTEVGELVHRAKDLDDPGAATELAERFACLAGGLPATGDDSLRLVTPVPSTAADCSDDRLQLTKLLASSLAAAGAGEYQPGLVVKTNPTPRMRHVEPERRAEVAASAGYRAHNPVAGRHIVIVDDVMLTGTTLNAVATCLLDAGAASVTAAVAVRTRRR